MHKLICTALLGLALATTAASAAPSSQASLERLLEVSQARKISEQAMAQVNGMLKPMLDQMMAKSDMSAQARQNAQAFMDSYIRKVTPILDANLGWEQMKPLMLQVYGESFTDEEIQGLIRFYESPAGQAMVQKMPVVMQKSMGAMQQRMGPMMEQIAAAARDTIEEAKAAQQPQK